MIYILTWIVLLNIIYSLMLTRVCMSTRERVADLESYQEAERANLIAMSQPAERQPGMP